jgi:tRNA A22 N-methylase
VAPPFETAVAAGVNEACEQFRIVAVATGLPQQAHERAEPRVYSAEELYFGPLQMQARSPAFLLKWQRILRHKQQTLTHFARARQAVPEAKLQEIARQARWITELLA